MVFARCLSVSLFIIPSFHTLFLISLSQSYQVQIQGANKPFIRNVFTLGTCAGIVGSQVHAFDCEKEMLQAWTEFVQRSDPDIVTGE